MLINIIFISKQTKIADFHTLYIMKCRHPKETAALKKIETSHRRHSSPIAISAQGNSNQLSHQASEQIPFGPPLEKAGRHRRFPHTSQTFQRYELRRQAQHLHRVAACASRTKTIASAQLHDSNSLAASQLRSTAGLKTTLKAGQNQRSARK